jgi:hypothetical protein
MREVPRYVHALRASLEECREFTLLIMCRKDWSALRPPRSNGLTVRVVVDWTGWANVADLEPTSSRRVA